MSPDYTSDHLAQRERDVRMALKALGEPDALSILRELLSQPRSTGDLSRRLDVDDQELWDCLVSLSAAQVIASWGGGWRLTELGQGLYLGLSPVLNEW